jgi:hypothetical protein
MKLSLCIRTKKKYYWEVNLYFETDVSFSQYRRQSAMCRNIRTLYNFEPPVTEEEILAASLQFVRKISGFNKPSRTNEAAFYAAVDDIARISGQLLGSLESTAAPKNRQEEAAKAKVRAAQRFDRWIHNDLTAHAL